MGKNKSIKTPCIRECKYDDDNICIACYRTKQEITFWGDYSDDEKLKILERIAKKKK